MFGFASTWLHDLLGFVSFPNGPVAPSQRGLQPILRQVRAGSATGSRGAQRRHPDLFGNEWDVNLDAKVVSTTLKPKQILGFHGLYPLAKSIQLKPSGEANHVQPKSERLQIQLSIQATDSLNTRPGLSMPSSHLIDT